MSRRTLLYFVLAALFCAQLQAAQPRAPHPAPFEHHDELMDQLMHGTPKLRAHAQFRLAQMGTRISLELTSKLSSAKRPATPWSFAMKLRRYLDGEANVVEAMNYLNSRMYAVLNPKMQNAGPADLPQFAGYVKRTSNDEEVFQKIQALPYIAGASQENADAMASLLDHSHVGLQNAALTGLERYCSFAVLPTKVEPFLKSKSIEQFMSAARILARQKHDGVIDAVLTRVRSEPLVLASTLAPIFADCDRAELLPKLNELLQDADPRMQTVAAGYLLALNDSKDAAEAKLVEQLGATIPDVQISAAWVLYELGSDKVKETVRAKINLARPQLNRVFLGATGWLSEKPDGKKHAQEIAKLSLVNAAAPTGEWAINLRDQLRLGLHKEVNEVVRASAVAIADEVGAPALPPKAPIPAKPAANNTAKPKVMRTYNSIATPIRSWPRCFRNSIRTRTRNRLKPASR